MNSTPDVRLFFFRLMAEAIQNGPEHARGAYEDLAAAIKALEHDAPYDEPPPEATEVIALRVRVRVSVPRAQAFAQDFGQKTDLVTLVNNEVLSNLEGQLYVVEVIELQGESEPR